VGAVAAVDEEAAQRRCERSGGEDVVGIEGGDDDRAVQLAGPVGLDGQPQPPQPAAAAAGEDLVTDHRRRLLVVERADAGGQSPQVGLELDRPVFEDQDRLEYTPSRIRAGALNRARRL
jgi:hypothetical protein